MTIIGTDIIGAALGSPALLRHGRFVANRDGAISSIQVYSTVNGTCKIALYADDDGEPGSLIVANNSDNACVSAQWNFIPLLQAVNLVGGEYYWLSSIISTLGVTSGNAGAGYTRFKTWNYSDDMPDPAGSGYTSSTFVYSLRAFDISYSTNAIQEGDVRMWHVDDRGEIEEKDGLITMTVSFGTMVYLTLFGGNEDDNNSESTELLQWWGNEGEPPERQYRSRFQYECSRGRPLTSGHITTLIEAAENDLKDAFITTGYGTAVDIEELEIVTPKHIRIAGFVTLDDGTTVAFDVEGDIT